MEYRTLWNSVSVAVSLRFYPNRVEIKEAMGIKARSWADHCTSPTVIRSAGAPHARYRHSSLVSRIGSRLYPTSHAGLIGAVLLTKLSFEIALLSGNNGIADYENRWDERQDRPPAAKCQRDAM